VNTENPSVFRRMRACWRPLLLGIAIILTATIAAWLYLHGSERAERAALAIGGTLIGMLLLGALVCKR
jgi:hypothetical protein